MITVTPDGQDKKFAAEIHGKFSAFPGSDRIASEFAIACLSATLRMVKPRTVLEFGAGIGTLTYTLLQHAHRIDQLVSTEANDFCLQQLAANISSQHNDRWNLVNSIEDVRHMTGHFDLVIFDGVNHLPDAVELFADGATCFVEGGRDQTRKDIERACADRGFECSLVHYNPGSRHFVFRWGRGNKAKDDAPFFQFRKPRKGCWIGQLSPAADTMVAQRSER